MSGASTRSSGGPPGAVMPQELSQEQDRLQKLFDQQKAALPESQQSSVPTPPELQAVQEQVQGYNARRNLWAAGLAGLAVVTLTLTNVLGVVLGKLTQNLLSLAKVLGLGAIVFGARRRAR